MTIHPALETVGLLFRTHVIFRVPRYQRYYAWNAEQIADFVGDLEACVSARQAGAPRQHFFGGLVTVRVGIPLTQRQNMEVIDGQQRLASFSMLAAQLRHAALKLAADVDATSEDNPKAFLIQFAAQVRQKYERFVDKVVTKLIETDRLELSQPDLVFFKELMDGRNPAPSRQSHLLLAQAWEKIGSALHRLLAAAGSEQAKAEVLSVIDTVIEDDWVLIHTVTDTKSEAYRLFRVLNDRGTSLTEGELLRSQLLEALDGASTSLQMRFVEETWDKILGAAPDEVEQQLRAVYASITGRRPGKLSLLDEYLTSIFPEQAVVPLTTDGATALVARVKQLEREIALLKLLQDGEWPYPASPSVPAWDRNRLRILIMELKHTNCMPLLLAAVQLAEKDFSEIVQMLERFMFRYKIVADAHIGPATKVYHSMAVEIRKNASSFKPGALREALQALLDKHASELLFRSRLREMVYVRDGNNRTIKYLLATIEHYLRWYLDGAQGLPRCKDKMVLIDQTIATIEHIYPGKAQVPDPDLEPMLDMLGNLTLLGPGDNGAAGNKPYVEKRQYFQKSALKINNDLATDDTWTADAVKKRQKKLEDVAVTVFRLAPN